ncbi:hypothetical protein [Nocardia sp. NPDC057227]|uniref:hypothetical protein n=1 Tax=Nocardia sp. NPDC057227 TaxID=3346056 RepID=UPI00363A8DB6
MAVRSADLPERGFGTYSPTEWLAHARRYELRYRLVVVAPDVAEVVHHLGGWLFDMRASGWEVIVPVSDPAAVRPLEILGAVPLDLEHWPAAAVREIRPDVLAIAVDSYRSDLVPPLGGGHSETVLWGGLPPEELGYRMRPARHRVSVAGRAFKSCAVRASGARVSGDSCTETFWAGAEVTGARRLLELAPAG